MNPRRFFHDPIALFFLCVITLGYTAPAGAFETGGDIASVKLYQNQAMISRTAKVTLKQGMNTITVTGLPSQLYDWSVRGKLPADFNGKISSVEVSKNALTKKRSDRILEIEVKLQSLRDRDQVLLDDLKSLKSQERFLESILNFTGDAAVKEIAAAVPQVSVWDGTVKYVNSRTRELYRDRRKLESDREDLGKEIQKWEFELSQAGGANYFNAYQAMNRALMDNRSQLAIQSYDKTAQQYGERTRLLKNPEGSVDYEKRVEIAVYSPAATESTVELTYIIPNTKWGMKYDIRASEGDRKVAMSMFADIFQMTGEDWDAVKLSLSTGQPSHSIALPVPEKWIVDVTPGYSPRQPSAFGMSTYRSRTLGGADEAAAGEEDSADREDGRGPVTTIEQKGPNFEVAMPLQQTIPSSQRFQKKMIRDFVLSEKSSDAGESPLRFFYELYPANSEDGFLKVAVKNNTSLPWLEGEAQIFFENEFMGKAVIPYTPQGKEREIVLGIENRVGAKKELVKKFEDDAGLFGGRRRIRYRYLITLENDFSESKNAVLFDSIPVSRNKEIEVSMESLNIPYLNDDDTVKSTAYSQGTRKWAFTLGPHEKKEISYELIFTFDKDVSVRGLR